MTISKITTIAELDNGPVDDSSMVLQRVDNIDTYATGKQIKEYIAAASQADFEREVNTRATTDADLFGKINTETSNRQTADATLQTNINTEAQTRADGDANLQTQITSLDSRTTETENAISVLNGDGVGSVNKKVSDAVAGILNDAPEAFDTLKEISDWIGTHSDSAATMQSNIAANATAIANETAARVGDSLNLAASIATETTNRENADTTLQANIDSEATSRQNADTNLQNSIDLINTKWSNVFGNDDDLKKKNPVVKELAVSSQYLENGSISNILTATYTDDNTRDFTIYGNKGDRGATWLYGTALTGISTDPTIFSNSGIEFAEIGDVYRNTDNQNTYVCVKAGSAQNAEWIFTGCLSYPSAEMPECIYWVESNRIYDKNFNLLSKIFVKMEAGYRIVYGFKTENGTDVFASKNSLTTSTFYSDIDLTHLTTLDSDLVTDSIKTYYVGTVVATDNPTNILDNGSADITADSKLIVLKENGGKYTFTLADFKHYLFNSVYVNDDDMLVFGGDDISIDNGRDYINDNMELLVRTDNNEYKLTVKDLKQYIFGNAYINDEGILII